MRGSEIAFAAAILLLVNSPLDHVLLAQVTGEESRTIELRRNSENNNSEGTGQEEPVSLKPDRVQFVESAFAAKCAVCHGKAGEGTEVDGTNLIDGVWKHGGALHAIKAIISDGVPDTTMKAQRDNFDAAQIADLASFVQLLVQRKKEPPPPSVGSVEKKTRPLNRTAAPAGISRLTEGNNIIDEYIFGKMKADGVPHAGSATDIEFMRRVYLDLWGRTPSPNAIRKFVSDPDPMKRERLIDQLLGLDYPRLREVVIGLQRSNPDWSAQKIAEQVIEMGLREAYYPDDLNRLVTTVIYVPSDQQSDEPIYNGPRYWLVEEPFVSKWAFFFEDLFRNALDAKESNRDQFRRYLERALRLNVPYDYMVRDMLTATTVSGSSNGASGYLIRHAMVIGEPLNHEDTCDEIAVHATRNFLGVDLRCISCHDGQNHLEQANLWLSKRTRQQFWRQVAFFGRTQIFQTTEFAESAGDFAVLDTLAIKSVRRGGIANVDFTSLASDSASSGYRLDATSQLRTPRDENADVFAEFILGGKVPEKGTNLRQEFARFVTSDIQFARTAVNLIWSKFMTVGIVDPPLGFDLDRQDPQNPPPEPWTIQPSHPELLDALAKDFVNHGYDLRHLMRMICQSKAYQLSSFFDGEYKPEFDRYYARKLVRRLTAEEVHDLIVTATNVKGDGVVNTNKDWSGYATDLPCPLAGVCEQQLQDFLIVFGRGDRQTSEPNSALSVLQSCEMMYQDFVKSKALSSNEGSRVRDLLEKFPPWTWSEPENRNAKMIIDELYLASLSRFPTESETAEALKHIKKYRDPGVEDLQWALLNRAETILNY